MKKLTLVFVLLFCVAPLLVFAGGRKANESHEVDNLEGFTESVNVEAKKAGKWNIYVEAQDKGGNTYRAGPHNIYIDPESDLPVARIINPQANMHVQGNLNIVGTCLDDDGVGYVELVITRGSDGKGEVLLETRAQGTEFWSYFVDTSDTEKWRDGIYTISAWGVDVNGLSGISDTFKAKVHKKHQVTWNLDRKKPEISVTSHELGALVNGKVVVKGTVWDGNGVENLYYSLDGSRYLPAKLKYNKRDDIYSFDISLDTRTLEDGPSVIRFRAKDKMKTEGAFSFLIFANNTGPDVQILYPEETEAVNGIFTVAGYAMHKIGLSSLSYKLGKKSGEIPLVVGNPWWVQEFDIRGENTRSLDLEIRAVDLSGNVTVAKRKLIVDQDADKPKVTLSEPAAGAVIEDSGLSLIGQANDDDGVASIFYAIGTNPPVEVPCSGYFQLVVENIPPGIHNMDVWAKDITGVVGPKVSVKGLVVPGEAPAPKFTRVLSGSGKTAAVQDFYSGINVNAIAGATLELAVSSGSALQSLSYQFGSRAPVVISVKGGKGGETLQTIPLPKDIEAGQLRMEIIAKDIYNREKVYEDFIHVLDAGGERPYASETFTWIRPNNSVGGGRILLAVNDVLTGIYNRGPLISIQVSSEHSDAFRVYKDDNGVMNLVGLKGGTYDNVRFFLTGADGSAYDTPAYRFIVDSGRPVLSLSDSLEGKWVKNEIPVKFTISGGNKISAVEFSANLGVNWQPLLSADEISKYTPNTLIERTLNIASLSDGAVVVHVRVRDEANNEAVQYFSVNKDTKAPEGRLIVPISGARVNGTIRLGIAIKESGKLASVVYDRPETATEDGVLPAITKLVYSGDSEMSLSFLDVLLESGMPLDKAMSFTFTDAAGNSSVLSNWLFTIDQEMDLPVTQIGLPMEGETITTDFIISGVCYDDDKIKQIFWRIDDRTEWSVEAENGFSIPISLSFMTDNEHTVTIYAEDIYGVKGKPVTRNFRVSLKEPVATLVYPTSAEIVGGQVVIKGNASDENGIALIQISLDNGNTYNDAGGTAEWAYSFNSKIIQDGNHPVFVKVVDNYDISAMYSFLINIDNTPPELTLSTPTDGAETTGPLYFTGQVMDAMRLESVTIKLGSLEGVKIPENLAVKTAKLESLLLEEMDISSLPDGNYNIEVWATDMAKNTSRAARNIKLVKDGKRNFVDMLFPLDGQHLRGNFDIYGYLGGLDKATHVSLLVNGRESMIEEVSEAGYYRFHISPESIEAGQNVFMVRSNFGAGGIVESSSRTVLYTPDGPWVTVDTMSMGDFAFERPWLFGSAGYVLSEEDRAILADKKADKEAKAEAEAKKLELVELSFDNGMSFFAANKSREKNSDWRYRLETGEMTEGLHYLVVRATMANGERAITRLLIQVDKTSPSIRLITPEPGGRYNEELEFAALSSDDVELKSVSYHLRKGDKALYGIPGFIKGLYFEGTIPPFIKVAWNKAPAIFAGGATFFDVGMGLSFFDDNVKVQIQYGQMTQKQYELIGGDRPVRYGGHVLGLKLLANVYQLPFGSFLGPDWDWLSASFALGANFSFFDLAKQGYTQSGKPTWMSALLLQIEFPKITIPKRTYLRTFSLFTEGQLWFVPTDVDASKNKLSTVIPHIIVGLRVYIF